MSQWNEDMINVTESIDNCNLACSTWEGRKGVLSANWRCITRSMKAWETNF